MKIAAERDRVGMTGGDRGIRRLPGEAAGGDELAVPNRPEQHHRRRHILMVDLGTPPPRSNAVR